MNKIQFNSWLKSPNKTLIMGILNITPDSFSDGGKFLDSQVAANHAIKMIENGADMIDVGGESSRPGAKPVLIDEELKRILPVIKAIREKSDCLISVDTYKSKVAEAALNLGADLINDISSLSFDGKMAGVISAYKVPLVLMHMQGVPENMQLNPLYVNIINDLITFFKSKISIAKEAGVSNNMIILDPGIGFGKRVDDNFEIIRELKQICNMGYPILLGTSRKSFIGDTLGLPINDRLEGTLASVAIGVLNGSKILRVHDIIEVRRTVTIVERIIGNK